MKQAAAAVGQCELMHIYDKMFLGYGINVAQILLTRENIVDDDQRENIHNTFTALMRTGVVPIVNENDTVATAELKHIENFGDNDTPVRGRRAHVRRRPARHLLGHRRAVSIPTRAKTRRPSSSDTWPGSTRKSAAWRAAPARRTARAASPPKITAAELCMDAGHLPCRCANGAQARYPVRHRRRQSRSARCFAREEAATYDQDFTVIRLI